MEEIERRFIFLPWVWSTSKSHGVWLVGGLMERTPHFLGGLDLRKEKRWRRHGAWGFGLEGGRRRGNKRNEGERSCENEDGGSRVLIDGELMDNKYLVR